MRVPIWRQAAASVAMLSAFPTFSTETTPALKMPHCTPSNHEDYYPPSLQRDEFQGEVLLDFRIDQHGSPRDVRVVATGPGPKGKGFARPGIRLMNGLSCTVPKDWTKTGGVEHRFRMWVFFNLSTGCETSATPTAADLGVDGVIQITMSLSCSDNQASQLQRARDEAEARQRALSNISSERYAAARDRCRAKAGDNPLCDQLTADDVLRSEAVAAKAQQ